MALTIYLPNLWLGYRAGHAFTTLQTAKRSGECAVGHCVPLLIRWHNLDRTQGRTLVQCFIRDNIKRLPVAQGC